MAALAPGPRGNVDAPLPARKLRHAEKPRQGERWLPRVSLSSSDLGYSISRSGATHRPLRDKISVLNRGTRVKIYESKDIRNVGMVGHGDSGKTTLTAGLLFTAGASNRLLRVDEGNTITDFDEEEIQRKITISTAIAVAEWKKTKINILDTPGYNIFINDTRGALVAADAALVLVDGVAGVEVQTEKVWSFADDFKLPRAVVINKLDRERADFQRALASVQEFFGRAAVPIHLPIGSERDFKGIIDLIRMKAYTYTPDG